MDRKQTVLANARAEIRFTRAYREYLLRYKDDPNAWFARDRGDAFLGELGSEWNSIFIEYLQEFYYLYLQQLGVEIDDKINVELTDSRRGSWIMEAVLTMFGTVGTAYHVLKAVGELPKIADGIEETKDRVQSRLSTIFQPRIRERIEPYLGQAKPSMLSLEDGFEQKSPPTSVVNVSFFIDARPLRSLTPDKVHSHSIHLAVGLSRSSLSVENLGETQLANLRIGLFKSNAEMHQWAFAEAYSKTVPTLNKRQTISFSITEFEKSGKGAKLALDENNPLYVDCWVQDNNGIYLFNFFLE